MRISCPGPTPEAAKLLSQFQRHIMAWLADEEKRAHGT
jgi:hypothetical protein